MWRSSWRRNGQNPGVRRRRASYRTAVRPLHSALSQWLARQPGKNAANSTDRRLQQAQRSRKTSPQALCFFALQCSSCSDSGIAKGPASLLLGCLLLLSPREASAAQPIAHPRADPSAYPRGKPKPRARSSPFLQESSRQVVPRAPFPRDRAEPQWAAPGFLRGLLHRERRQTSPPQMKRRVPSCPALLPSFLIPATETKALERETIATQFP